MPSVSFFFCLSPTSFTLLLKLFLSLPLQLSFPPLHTTDPISPLPLLLRRPFLSPPFPLYPSTLILLLISLHLLHLFLCDYPLFSVVSRIWWGGPWRRPAAFLCEGVLVVPTYVEPHAAPSIPQPVCAGWADVAQQEICHGESQGAKVRSQLWVSAVIRAVPALSQRHCLNRQSEVSC